MLVPRAPLLAFWTGWASGWLMKSSEGNQLSLYKDSFSGGNIFYICREADQGNGFNLI